MVHPNTRRSTALLVLVALAHVVHHSFVVAPFPALRVHCSVRPSGIIKMRVLRQVGANQHWPYGLVDAEGSKFYARQLNGDFFADVKNSSFFLQALKEDAQEKQVDADAFLQSISNMADAFMAEEPRQIIDRLPFIEAVKGAIRSKGKLTLILGGKSVGKSTVIQSVVANFTQAKRSQRTVVFTDMREMPAKDFFTAVLSTAPPLMAFRSAVSVAGTSIFIRFLAGVLSIVPKVGKLVSDSLARLLDNMDGKMKQEGFVSLVRRAGKGIAIIVDEANIALPRDDDLTEAKAARDALAEIVSITKQNVKASVVLISSEHGYPFKLAKAGLNLVDIKNIVIAPEVPPNDMLQMLKIHWGMGHRLARLFVATYGGSIDAVYTALGNLINNRKQFYPLGTTSVPGIGNCMVKDDAREHLINIALDGFSPVSSLEQDEGAKKASAGNVAGIIPREAQKPGLWPDVFHETKKEYVLVASTHHVRLKICKALLDEGYIQNNGGNLVRVSPSWFQSLLQMFR